MATSTVGWWQRACFPRHDGPMEQSITRDIAAPPERVSTSLEYEAVATLEFEATGSWF